MVGERFEKRILLSATSSDVAEEQTAEDQAAELQAQYTGYEESYLESSSQAFATASSSLSTEADYEDAIENSPISNLVNPFLSEFTVLDEGEQAIAQAEQDAEANAESSTETGQQSSEAEFSNSDTSEVSLFEGDALGFATQLVGDGTTNFGTPDDTADTQQSSDEDGDTNEESQDEDGAAATEEAVDPRFDWTPLQVPVAAQPDYSSLPAYSKLGNLSTVEPTGQETFENETITESDPVVLATPAELGTGTKTETVTTTTTLSQEYVSENDWIVTQSITTKFVSEEDSEDTEEADQDFDRTTITTFTVTVINGTDSIVTYSVSDSFGYETESSWDDSTQDESEENSGGDDTGDDTESQSEDDGNDVDKGEFEASVSASSSMSITLATSLVTMDDGIAYERFVLSYNTAESFESRTAGGYNVEDEEGELEEQDEEEDSEEEGDSEEDGEEAGSATANSTGNDDATAGPGDDGFDPNSPVEHGGNGSDIDASADFEFTAGAGKSTALSLGAMVPVGGNMEDADVFGSAGFSADASVGGTINQNFDADVQESGGNPDDDTDTYTYLSVGSGGGSGGSKSFNVGMDLPFGYDPMDGSNQGPSDNEVDIGFGLTMANHGNSNSYISLKHKDRWASDDSFGWTQVGFGAGGSSGSDFSFGIGTDENGEIEVSVSVTTNSNSGSTIGVSSFGESPYDDEFSVIRDHVLTVNAEKHESSVTVTLTVSASGSPEVESTVSLTDSSILMTENWFEVYRRYVNEDGSIYEESGVTGMRETSVSEASGNLEDGFESRAYNTWQYLGGGYAFGDPPNITDDTGTLTMILDGTQFGLDMVGLVPGFGEAADLLNAGISIGRGNYGDATMSLVAMVPFLGAGATAGKLANKGGNAIVGNLNKVDDGLSAISSKLDDVADACKSTGNCFVAGTQVVVATSRHSITMPPSGSIAYTTNTTEEDSASVDAFYAALAFMGSVTLTAKSQPRLTRKKTGVYSPKVL